MTYLHVPLQEVCLRGANRLFPVYKMTDSSKTSQWGVATCPTQLCQTTRRFECCPIQLTSSYYDDLVLPIRRKKDGIIKKKKTFFFKFFIFYFPQNIVKICHKRKNYASNFISRQ